MMERKIQWSTGCFDKIDGIYGKAAENEIAAQLLSDLETGALAEARAHCGMIRVQGRPITPAEFDQVPHKIKEALMESLSKVGLVSFSTPLAEPKVIVHLSAHIERVCCCTAFSILNQLQMMDEDIHMRYSQVFLEFRDVPADKQILVPLAMLIGRLYAWVKITGILPEETTDAPTQSQWEATQVSQEQSQWEATQVSQAQPQWDGPQVVQAESTVPQERQKNANGKPGFWAKLFDRKNKKAVPEIEQMPAGPAVFGQTTEASTASVDFVLQQNREVCDYTVQQQQQWLEVLNKAIPTISLGADGIDRYLEPRMLEQADNMLNTVGRIAYATAKSLADTQMETVLKTDSAGLLIWTYGILKVYADMLREPYCDVLSSKTEYIYSVLKNTDLSQLAATSSADR